MKLFLAGIASVLVCTLAQADSCATPFDYIPTSEWSAIIQGSSAYDATASINQMLANGARCFSFQNGTYNVSASLAIPGNAALIGNGAAIKAPAAGWTLIPHTGFGIFNLYNVSNVTISGFHLMGTKVASLNSTPKLIYYDNSTNIEIASNWLDNSAFEGIWGDNLSTIFSVHDNRITNVGFPAAQYVGLPAIQANFSDGVVSNNVLGSVGTGIGVSGSRTVVTGNRINGVTMQGIGTGDGGSVLGTIIEGNSVEFTSDGGGRRVGIHLGISLEPVSVIGNTVRVTATLGGNYAPACIDAVGAAFPYIGKNTCQIGGPAHATGIYLEAPHNGAMTAHVRENYVAYSGQDGSQVFAIQGVPGNSASVLTATIAGNVVLGASPANGYAFDLNNISGGTVNAALIDNIKDGGYARIGQSFVALTGADNNWAYRYNNIGK